MFPKTSFTRIVDLVKDGGEDEWRSFVSDYWVPVYRFSLHRGARRDDAEEITLEVFEELWKQDLLRRWTIDRAAKLRTLICTVARNKIVERFRKRKPNEAIVVEPSDTSDDPDCFYAAWAEDLLVRTFDTTATHYRRAGQSDYLRVFVGRTIDKLTIDEVAEALSLPDTTVDHQYRHVRDRLQQELRKHVGEQVKKNSAEDEFEARFAEEWQQLHSYLQRQGDLEAVLLAAFADIDREEVAAIRRRGVGDTVTRLTAIGRRRRDAKP